MKLCLGLAAGVTAATFFACGGSSTTDPTGNPGDGSSGSPTGSSGSPASSGGTSGSTGTSGSSGTSGASGSSGSAGDGAPTRIACTSAFGSGLTSSHGRLDGYLVSIVPTNTHGSCNGDGSHLHLQVKANGEVYDIAVNLDTLEADTDAALPGGAWSEGWHANQRLDYPNDLGLHAPAFMLTDPNTQRTNISATLANANHISIYATGYGPGGAHDVHRRGASLDGAIAINPLDPKAHILAFRFTTDSF
jgi:hypothetical protein